MQILAEVDNVKIGDRIIGKRTGTMTPSTVVGFLPARYNQIYSMDSKWDSLYPDWREKYLVYCEFDEPTRNVSFQEFVEDLPLPESSENEFIQALVDDKQLYMKFARSQYLQLIKPTFSVCYPIDDVDVI